jgi:hypothetical protein
LVVIAFTTRATRCTDRVERSSNHQFSDAALEDLCEEEKVPPPQTLGVETR